MEEKGALEWPFQFWDNEEKCRLRQKMEGLNDMVADVYVQPLRGEVQEPSKRHRLDDGSHVADLNYEGVAEEDCTRSEDRATELLPDEPLGSSRVTGSITITEALDHQNDSKHLPKDVWERYLEGAEKLKRALKCSSQEDNRWVL